MVPPSEEGLSRAAPPQPFQEEESPHGLYAIFFIELDPTQVSLVPGVVPSEAGGSMHRGTARASPPPAREPVSPIRDSSDLYPPPPSPLLNPWDSSSPRGSKAEQRTPRRQETASTIVHSADSSSSPGKDEGPVTPRKTRTCRARPQRRQPTAYKELTTVHMTRGAPWWISYKIIHFPRVCTTSNQGTLAIL